MFTNSTLDLQLIHFPKKDAINDNDKHQSFFLNKQTKSLSISIISNARYFSKRGSGFVEIIECRTPDIIGLSTFQP